ncbi:MAG: protein kinase [Acidobacteriota bacterium]|nr:protein kinase [Acidobacteriota bacterium]
MESIGRYKLVGELGRGAMGIVYHATDPSIGRSVAIKTIRIRDINDTRQREKLRERLFREARSAGVLSHPNIVTIYDMDEADGLAYIAMAYVNGPTLEKILASRTPLSGAKMLRILRQAASGLDYAHSRGIVHRDVKPANIMTDEDGAVKITDFGIAKIIAASSMTDTRMVVGTPNYMSPEQVQGLAIDGRSDQFSLAVIAYEILTGERPFNGEHLSTVVYRIVAEDPAEAPRINSTLTAQIDEVLRRGLAKKPENRYPSCSNFVGALEMACAESRGWTTPTAGASAALPTDSVKKTEPPALPALERIPGPAVSHRDGPSVLLPVVLSLLVVAGVAGVIAWQAGILPSVFSFLEDKHSRESATAALPPPPVQTAPEAEPEAKPIEQAPRKDPPQNDPPPALQTIAPLAPVLEVKKPAPVASGQGSREAGNPGPIATQPPRDRLQDVWITTNPPGAKAVLDGDLSMSCQTPCMVHAASGTHNLTFSQAGYENEYREVHVGETAEDVPPITLRKLSGILMLTTNPPGATIRIDGHLVPQVTPAQLTLSPGNYSITVEKSGKTQTQKVEIQQSPIYLRIPL